MKTNVKLSLMAIIMAFVFVCPQPASAVEKEVTVWCLKTNSGKIIPLVRVSMMVVPDGSDTFDILLKDGEGESGVKNITFERSLVNIDLDKYIVASGESDIVDLTKKCYMFTNTGKYFSLGADKPMLNGKEGTSLFNVTDRNGNVLAGDVSEVKFLRTNDPEASYIEAPVMDGEENLTLLTPISTQMQISGCGNATKAFVYDMNGKQVNSAPVSAGNSTIVVAELPAGIYVVKVGNKSLKFIKK